MPKLTDLYNEIKRNLPSFILQQWTPRILAAGVDYYDLQRLLANFNDWDQWLGIWVKSGDAHQQEGDRHAAEGRLVTASAFYLRASLAYHYGQFMWFSDMDEKRATYKKCASVFRKAAPLLSPPAHRIEVPWKDEIITGYVRIPATSRKPPLVVFIPGADAWKEELASFTNFFLERGMATVICDGPAQGDLSHLPLKRTNYEEAISTVLDWMEVNYREVDSERVGIAGISLGGYLAPRCAAADSRFKAACGVAGPYDLSNYDATPNLLKVDIGHLMGFEDTETASRLGNSVINLSDVIENLRCPLLIVHGDQDRIVKDGAATKITDNANGIDKQLVIMKDANHVCNNYVYVYRPLVADWMAGKLNVQA
jgi:dipeptidyl aminopeptidase/acylaminoacyl peptidase